MDQVMEFEQKKERLSLRSPWCLQDDLLSCRCLDPKSQPRNCTDPTGMWNTRGFVGRGYCEWSQFRIQLWAMEGSPAGRRLHNFKSEN